MTAYWLGTWPTTDEKCLATLVKTTTKEKHLLSSGSYFKVSVVSCAGPWTWTSVRGRAGCMRTPHPSYDSSLMRIRNVFPDLRMGLDGVLAFQGRVLESSVVSLEPAGLWTETFSSDTAGAIMLSCMRAIVCYHCCLNGLSNCLCVQFIILLAAQVYSRVYDIICFIFIMRFGNPYSFVRLSTRFSMFIFLWKRRRCGAETRRTF